MLTTIGIIVGAVLATFLLCLIEAAVAVWLNEKIGNSNLNKAAISLSLSSKNIWDDENEDKVVRYFSERYSDDLFSNRLADLFGFVVRAWSWAGLILEAIMLSVVIWLVVSESAEYAIFAWLIPVVELFFWVVALLFLVLAHFITGRYPGEPSDRRKYIVEFLNSRQNLHSEE